MKLAINKKDFILLFILISMIFPTIRFLGFEMPFAYLYAPFGFFIVLYILFGQVKMPKPAKTLFAICFIILLQILLSTYLSTTNRLGHFVFPTDSIQYAVRFIFLFAFMAFAYSGQIKPEKFIRYFLYILLAAMLIGILQWVPWPGRVFFIKLYPFRDGKLQLSQLNRSLANLRLHGFAQMATANGGIAAFSFIYAYSIYQYYKEHKKASIVLLVLSFVNVIASQARAGMLALVSSIFMFYIVSLKYNRKKLREAFLVNRKSLRITLTLIATIIVLIMAFIVLYYIENRYVVNIYQRWIKLVKTAGGARLQTQPRYFLSIMNGTDYLMGLSKPVINLSEITHGVEVEPINIFVTFGAIGFILQYLLVLVLLRHFYRRISKKGNNKASLSLIVSSFVGLFCYQVFSVGYFFFREIRVGLFPWVLMGVAIGYYARLNKYKAAYTEGLLN